MVMNTAQRKPWFYSNQYTADSACEHCSGVLRHEPWCVTRNLHVMNAWEAVRDPAMLSFHDQLILHALGVAWIKICHGSCKARPGTV